MENENFEAAYEAYAQDAFAAEAEAYWNRVLAEKEMIAQDKPKDNAIKIPVSRPPADQGGTVLSLSRPKPTATAAKAVCSETPFNRWSTARSRG